MEVNVRVVKPLEDYLLPQPARYVSIMDMDVLGEQPRRASSDEDLEAVLQENRH